MRRALPISAGLLGLVFASAAMAQTGTGAPGYPPSRDATPVLTPGITQPNGTGNVEAGTRPSAARPHARAHPRKTAHRRATAHGTPTVPAR